MLFLFTKFSEPYDPVFGKILAQKPRFMILFNASPERLKAYREHRFESANSQISADIKRQPESGRNLSELSNINPPAMPSANEPFLIEWDHPSLSGSSRKDNESLLGGDMRSYRNSNDENP